jgi:hypothetical protein
MTNARIQRLAGLDTRLSIAAAETSCAIRDGRKVWQELGRLEQLEAIERGLTDQLDALRALLRAELEAANQEQYPQQPGRTEHRPPNP